MRKMRSAAGAITVLDQSQPNTPTARQAVSDVEALTWSLCRVANGEEDAAEAGTGRDLPVSFSGRYVRNPTGPPRFLTRSSGSRSAD